MELCDSTLYVLRVVLCFALCCLLVEFQRFGWTYYIHLQGWSGGRWKWILCTFYHIHNSQPPPPFLIQTNPIHNFPHDFLKSNFNIIPSTPRSFQWSLIFTLFNQNFVCISRLSRTYYTPCSYHPLYFDLPNCIWWRVQIVDVNFLHYFATLSFLRSNISTPC